MSLRAPLRHRELWSRSPFESGVRPRVGGEVRGVTGALLEEALEGVLSIDAGRALVTTALKASGAPFPTELVALRTFAAGPLTAALSAEGLDEEAGELVARLDRLLAGAAPRRSRDDEPTVRLRRAR